MPLILTNFVSNGCKQGCLVLRLLEPMTNKGNQNIEQDRKMAQAISILNMN